MSKFLKNKIILIAILFFVLPIINFSKAADTSKTISKILVCPAGATAYYKVDPNKLDANKFLLLEGFVTGFITIGPSKYYSKSLLDDVPGNAKTLERCLNLTMAQADCKSPNSIDYDKKGGYAGCIIPPIWADSSHFTPYTQTTFIPCQPTAGGTCPEPTTPASFINRFYTFAMMIAGLLAFGAITYGGLKYLLAAGNLSTVSEAREIITNAIIGLILLFGAGIILYTINPQLLTLQNPNLTQLKTDTSVNENSSVTNPNNLIAVEHCITSILINLPISLTGTDNQNDKDGDTVSSPFEKDLTQKTERCLECATGYTLKNNKCEAN